jgi:hypothetical protein
MSLTLSQRVAEAYLKKTGSWGETVDLVVAVSEDQLLGAKDAATFGALNPALWRARRILPPFDLWRLEGVPMILAENLVDFGTPAARLRDGARAWKLAKKYAVPARPVKQV